MQTSFVSKKDNQILQLAFVGSSGKMGKALIALIKADEQFGPIVSIDRNNNDPDIENVDLLVDFSSPEGLEKALAICEKNHIPLLSGTTGLDRQLLMKLDEASKEIPIFYAANFSVGIALCSQMLKMVAKQAKEFSKIKILETHHTQKKDAPSGTALKLAHILDPNGSISIESVREGSVIGKHQVFFEMDNEKIELSHEAFSREPLAQGALAAIKFLHAKLDKPRLYSMGDLLFP